MSKFFVVTRLETDDAGRVLRRNRSTLPLPEGAPPPQPGWVSGRELAKLLGTRQCPQGTDQEDAEPEGGFVAWA